MLDSILVEYDSCESGSGILTYEGYNDIDEVTLIIGDDLMGMCNENDEIEAALFNSENDEFLGKIWGSMEGWHFVPA